MELYYNLAILFILTGLFLMVKNTGKKMFWGGALCILIASGIIVVASNTEITSDLIGVEVIKNTQAEYTVEMRFFKLKSQALEHYRQHQITNFSLCYRLGGDTSEFFKMIGREFTNTTAKRIRFTANRQKDQSAFEVYQDYFLQANLIPEDAKTKQK